MMHSICQTKTMRCRFGRTPSARCVVILMAMVLPGASAIGQVFDSGSDGSDGPLDCTTLNCPVGCDAANPCTILFDPRVFTRPDGQRLDPDNDNVYHFTTITIPAGVTVRLRAPELNYAPVYWLASGSVDIAGAVNLSGEPGHSGISSTFCGGPRSPSIPGPGGFPGGVGEGDGGNATPATAGFGPGGGSMSPGACVGNGASYATGGYSAFGTLLTNTYGNAFLLPFVGGSGGSGSPCFCAGGGAGGGALLIASSQSITVDGVIDARGGVGGVPPGRSECGGSGSGGAIRMLAPVVAGTGVVTCRGGDGCFAREGEGGFGRIRLEAFQDTFTGTLSVLLRRETLAPGTVFLPTNVPSVRVVDVDGLTVPDPPTGSFLTPDVTIGQSTVILTVEARNIPPGNIVTLFVFPEIGPDQVVPTTPLSGTLGLSTATATVTFELGFSRFMVRALWTP